MLPLNCSRRCRPDCTWRQQARPLKRWTHAPYHRARNPPRHVLRTFPAVNRAASAKASWALSRSRPLQISASVSDCFPQPLPEGQSLQKLQPQAEVKEAGWISVFSYDSFLRFGARRRCGGPCPADSCPSGRRKNRHTYACCIFSALF